MSNLKEIWVENMRRNPAYGFLIAMIVYLGMQIVLILLLTPIIGTVAGLSTEDVQAILGGDLSVSENSHSIFRIIQFLNQLLIWGLPAILLASVLGKPREVLSLETPRPAWLPVLAIGTILLSIPFVQWIYLPPGTISLPESLSGLEEALKKQEELGQETLNALFQQPGPMAAVANLLVFALVPAVCEELFFRGYLLGHARLKWNLHVSVWVVAALFSFIHLQPLGFFSRLLLGAFLGYFVVYGGKLWASMAAHFAFNATAIVAQIFASGTELEEVAAEETRPAWWIALISALLTAYLLSVYKSSAERADPESTV